MVDTALIVHELVSRLEVHHDRSFLHYLLHNLPLWTLAIPPTHITVVLCL
jgi:hypothetical protein